MWTNTRAEWHPHTTTLDAQFFDYLKISRSNIDQEY